MRVQRLEHQGTGDGGAVVGDIKQEPGAGSADQSAQVAWLEQQVEPGFLAPFRLDGICWTHGDRLSAPPVICDFVDGIRCVSLHREDHSDQLAPVAPVRVFAHQCGAKRVVASDAQSQDETEDEQPDDDEEVVGISEEAHSRGDHGLPMNERDGQVAAGSQDLGSMTRANVETIFNKGNITSNASYFPANHTVLTHLNRQHYCNRSSYTSYDRYIRPLHKYGGGNHIIRRENRGIGKLL